MKFVSYAMIGGSCALLNLALLWLLTSALGMHYLIAAMISFFALTPVGFWLQKMVTFRTPRVAARLEWPRYFTTMGSSFAANVALMYVFVSLLGIWYLAASVLVTLTLLAANFLVNDRWSFSLRR
ncbi:MAG TPA: GtrA family protein [Burkholderiales bacterium]|nr:GtrA family protein [Burkholderiales bacterium]